MMPDFRVLALTACLASLAGCGERAPAKRTLVVLAAASCTDVMATLASDFHAAEIVTSCGGSGALARQILDGAPADLFVSASREWVELLARDDQLLAPPRLLCRNRLSCVAPAGSPLLSAGPRDALALAARLPADARVAIAVDGVPAGDYARQSLARTGALAALRPHLVGLPDVRAVLRAVTRGEVAAGFVYATDARAGGVATLFAFDPATHAPIDYLVAVPRTATSPELAAQLFDFVTGTAAARVLSAAGFAVEGR